MKHVLLYLLPLVCIVFLSSCAATYKRINPSTIDYPVIEREGNFSYKYNVLKEAGNKKLSKKEDKEHIRILAIKLVNNTGETLKYGQNFKIYSGSGEVYVLDPTAAFASIKQTTPTYLLYLLLTPMRLNISNGKTSSSTPIGYVVGPALAAGNFAVAATANKNFKQELLNTNILEKEILNGETFYGLIAIRDNGFLPLSFKMLK